MGQVFCGWSLVKWKVSCDTTHTYVTDLWVRRALLQICDVVGLRPKCDIYHSYDIIRGTLLYIGIHEFVDRYIKCDSLINEFVDRYIYLGIHEFVDRDVKWAT